MIRFVGLLICFVGLYTSCQDEMQAIELYQAQNKVVSFKRANFQSIILDTMSQLSFSNDTIIIRGRTWISFDSIAPIYTFWDKAILQLSDGEYEISTLTNNPYVIVYTGSGRLVTDKIRMDIEAGNQLRILKQNYVITPVLSIHSASWLPDSLKTYK